MILYLLSHISTILVLACCLQASTSVKTMWKLKMSKFLNTTYGGLASGPSIIGGYCKRPPLVSSKTIKTNSSRFGTAFARTRLVKNLWIGESYE